MDKNNSSGKASAREEKKVSYGSRFIHPEKIIPNLKISKGMKVADFGCGTGYFSFPLAEAVGREGTVYAFDVLKSKLEAVAGRASLSGLTNISAKRVNLEKEGGSGLSDGSVDWVFLVNILFQNRDKEKILREAKRVLKKGGQALVVEWSGEISSIGPESGHRVSKEEILGIVRRCDFGITEDIEPGNFHYGLILTKYK